MSKRKAPGDTSIAVHHHVYPEQWESLFRQIATAGCTVAEACRRVFPPERPVNTIYAALKADVDLMRRFNEAKSQFAGMLMAEAVRRGVHGVDVPVSFKGEITHYVKEYSDQLLLALLRNSIPTFIDKRAQSEIVSHDGDAQPDVAWTITYEQASRLPADMQRQLLAIARWTKANAKIGDDVRHAPALLDADDDFSMLTPGDAALALEVLQ